MSEQPEARPDGQRGRQGKKVLGLPRQQAIGLGLFAVGGLIYLVWRARKNAQAAQSTASTAGSCPDGSTPDANGNCPQNSQDYSGQLATLQSEIAQLQQEGAGVSAGGSGGGGYGGGYGYGGGSGAGTVGGSTGTTTAPPTPAAPVTTTSPAYPMSQEGTVTSATTGRQGHVTTSNGGKTWVYAGSPLTAAQKKAEPQNQTGTVYSTTTQRTGRVASSDGGMTWNYVGVPSST